MWVAAGREYSRGHQLRHTISHRRAPPAHMTLYTSLSNTGPTLIIHSGSMTKWATPTTRVPHIRRNKFLVESSIVGRRMGSDAYESLEAGQRGLTTVALTEMVFSVTWLDSS